MKDYSFMQGRRYHRLVVNAVLARVFSYEGRPRSPYIECVCDCGTVKEFLASNVERGLTKSCGCFHREQTSIARTTHGETPVIGGRQKASREYKAWSHAIQRCENPLDAKYDDYGGAVSAFILVGATTSPRFWLTSVGRLAVATLLTGSLM